MNPTIFLAAMEMAYWELPNSDLDPRLVGFLFALSEYYTAAYIETDEYQSRAEIDRGYRVWDELEHHKGIHKMDATYEQYHENWQPSMKGGYEEGMRVAKSLRKV